MSRSSNPVLSPAALPGHGQRVVGTSPRTIAVTVGMEDRFQLLFQQHRCCGLGHPVRRVRHAEHPDPRPMIFRYLHRPHRPREVAPRSSSGSTACRGCPSPRAANSVMLTASTPGAPLFARTFSHASIIPGAWRSQTTSPSACGPSSAPPPQGWRRGDLACPAPSLRPHYRAFTATTSRSAPVPRSVLCPSRFRPLGVLPLATSGAQAHLTGGLETTGSPVPCQRPRRAHATYTPDTARATRRPPPGSGHAQRARLHPGDTRQPRFRCHRSILSMRQQWFTHVRLLVAHLTR